MTEIRPVQQGQAVVVFDETDARIVGVIHSDGQKLVWKECRQDFPEEKNRAVMEACVSGKNGIGIEGHIYALRRC